MILLFTNVPGVPEGTFEPESNASHYLDLLIFGDFSNALNMGPAIQGVVPTAGAVASTLIGLLAGTWLKVTSSSMERVSGLMVVGIVLLFVGMMFNTVIPISKPVWTPSYVVFMSGLSMQIQASPPWVTEILRCKRCVTAF